MLRSTLTKFKRTCSLAHVPRILRGDVWCSASNFEKLSAILMTKYKSTTSGSDDDEDRKIKKCKQLIDLAFGPDKLDAAERIEKIDVRKIRELESMVSPEIEVKCEKDKKMEAEGDNNSELSPAQCNIENFLNATKVEQKEESVQKFEKTDEIIEADGNMRYEDAKSEKCKQLIELVFGPDKPENLVDSKLSKLPEMDTENVTQMVTPGFINSEILNNKRNRTENEGHRNQEIDSTEANRKLVLHTSKVEDGEKLVQKIEKIEETPLVHTGVSSKMPFSNKYVGSKGRHMNNSRNLFEELAKRCVNSSNDKIDSNILKEMKRLGISQPLLQDLPTDNSKNVQKSTLKSKETSRALEKNNLKVSRRNIANRRAMKHLAMRMGTDNISDVTSSDNKTKLQMSKKDIPIKPITEKNSRAEREILIDREKSPNLTGTAAVNAVQAEIEKLNTERTEFQHERLIRCSEDDNDVPDILNKEKVKDSQKESIVTSNENLSTADMEGPAVLVKECDDPDGYRITPHTPKAETLTDRLSALNYQVQQSTFVTQSLQHAEQEKYEQQDQALPTKEADSSRLNKEIEKIFNDERIPRHLFAELTVISKNVPTDTEFGKILKDFYEQDLGKETTLIKPERLQYYSHNDEILQFRDCTQEADPHVVIREFEDYESDPTDTDPHSNYYSDSNYYNGQDNIYNQGNIYPNNMPSDNSGMSQNMAYYNKILANAVSPGNETWNSVLPNSVATENNDIISSDSSNITNKHDPISSNYDPNRVLIDPYGKNMRAVDWAESDNSNAVTLKETNPKNVKDNLHNIKITNEKSQYTNLALDPLFTSNFAVNDGTLVSGNESKSDHIKESKANSMIQQKRNIPSRTINVNPWIDKGTVTADSVKCNAYIEAQEPVKMSQMPVIAPNEHNMTLSEMLRKVRERARLEAYKQEVLIAAPVTEVDPTEGSCKKPKPPCPPPQKTCPPTPPKCPPSNCPEPQPPCPKPCKPACPDPCSTPKCPPTPKKDPCAKFVNQKTVDILGLVVTLGTLNIPQTATANKPTNENNMIPLLVDDILFRFYAITDGVLTPEIKNKRLMEDEEDIGFPDVLLDRSFYFPKDYEPWTPIPSWPIPAKRVKNKLVCPKDGCKIPPPPPPGARCNNIHHPCAGFPNDKKRT